MGWMHNLKDYLGWYLFFAGAVVTIIAHTAKVKQWWLNKVRRQEKLDELLSMSDNLYCQSEMKDCHEKQLSRLLDLSEKTEKVLEDIREHNRAQDLEIERSKEEREMLMVSVLATLDYMIKQGANGSAHSARDAINAYLIREAHK